jgi:oxalate decarboxylase/phosphoglucose isomerase-like protein (cupin superfamily)
VRRRQEGASTSIVIPVKLQKETILTAAGAHIHAVQNDCNWYQGCDGGGEVVSFKLVEREGGGVIISLINMKCMNR